MEGSNFGRFGQIGRRNVRNRVDVKVLVPARDFVLRDDQQRIVACQKLGVVFLDDLDQAIVEHVAPLYQHVGTHRLELVASLTRFVGRSSVIEQLR